MDPNDVPCDTTTECFEIDCNCYCRQSFGMIHKNFLNHTHTYTHTHKGHTWRLSSFTGLNFLLHMVIIKQALATLAQFVCSCGLLLLLSCHYLYRGTDCDTMHFRVQDNSLARFPHQIGLSKKGRYADICLLVFTIRNIIPAQGDFD